VGSIRRNSIPATAELGFLKKGKYKVGEAKKREFCDQKKLLAHNCYFITLENMAASH